MAASLEENLFVRLVSLFLEIAPLPMRELFRNRWDARYPNDKWHAGDGSDAERRVCGKLLLHGSECCTIDLPCPFKRCKGNELKPDGPPSGHVSPRSYFKNGDRVYMERRDSSGTIGQSVDARVAKRGSLEMSMTVEANGLEAPEKDESGWFVKAPRVHTLGCEMNATQEQKVLGEGIARLDVSGLYGFLLASGHQLCGAQETLAKRLKTLKDLRNEKFGHSTTGTTSQPTYDECRKAVCEVVDECVNLGFLDPSWKFELDKSLAALNMRSVYREDHILALAKVQQLYVAELQARKVAEQRVDELSVELIAARSALEETTEKIRCDPHLQLRQWVEQLPRPQLSVSGIRWNCGSEASASAATTAEHAGSGLHRSASASTCDSMATPLRFSSSMRDDEMVDRPWPCLLLLIQPENINITLRPPTVLVFCKTINKRSLTLHSKLALTCERWFVPLNDATLDREMHCSLQFVPECRTWVIENGASEHGTRWGHNRSECSEKLAHGATVEAKPGMWVELGALELHERTLHPRGPPPTVSRSHFFQVVSLSAGSLRLPTVINDRFEHEPVWGEKRGGFASVSKYLDVQRGHALAVKVPKTDGRSLRDAAIREIKAFLKLTETPHPNVVSLYHTCAFDGVPLLFMPLAVGGSLDKWLGGSCDVACALHSADARRTIRRAVDVIVQLFRALEHLHAHDLVHLDVKPSNILVRNVLVDDGLIHVQLCDFGLCSTRGGLASGEGTPMYRSPEQELTGGIVTCAADTWSGGVTVCQILARSPWRSGQAVAAKSIAEEVCSQTWSHQKLAWMPQNQVNVDGLPKTPRELMVELIRSTLQADRALRPTATVCLRMLRPLHQIDGQRTEGTRPLGASNRATRVANLRLHAYYEEFIVKDAAAAETFYRQLLALEPSYTSYSDCSAFFERIGSQEDKAKEHREKAIQLLAELVTCRALMKVCMDAKHLMSVESCHLQLDQAMLMLASIESAGVPVDVGTYNELISACIKAGQIGEAMRVFASMTSADVLIDVATYNELIMACAKAGQIAEAMRVLSMDRACISASTVAYNSLITACAKARMLDDAMRVFAGMEEAGVLPNAVTYNSLIAACANSKQLGEALRAFKAMEAAGVEADTVTYNTLITACVNARQLDEAMRVFGAMEAAGVEANVVTYGSLITACANSKQLGEAMRVFGAMEAAGVEANTVTYNALITACANSKQLDEAMRVFKAMEAAGVAANTVTYNSLVFACANAGQLGEALRVFKAMERAGVEADTVTYSTLIMASARGKELGEGLRLFDAMERAGVPANTVTYNALITESANAAQLDEAMRVFGAMERAGVAANAVTYSSLIMAHAKVKQLGEAMRVFEAMERAGIPANTITYNALITACANSKQLGEAMRVFEAMERAGVPADTITYNALITACRNAGDPGAAFDLFQRMNRCCLAGDSYTFSGVFAAVARDRSGRFDARAWDLFGSVPLELRNGFVYTPMMTICGRIARDRVLELLQEARTNVHCRPWPNSVVFDTARSICRERTLEIDAMEQEDAQLMNRPGEERSVGKKGKGPGKGAIDRPVEQLRNRPEVEQRQGKGRGAGAARGKQPGFRRPE
jgi:pentatricopeptide repeat protein